MTHPMQIFDLSYIISIPTKATNTANIEPLITSSVFDGAPLELLEEGGSPWVKPPMPVDAEPAALLDWLPPLPLPPPVLPELPVLPPPREPSVPGPAPVKPGTVATWLVATAEALLVPDGLDLG